MRRISVLALLVLCLPLSVFAQGNGKLQIHYMDVGQGDGAVLISPLGEVVLFDDGVVNQCGKPVGYLQSLGITKIDYHIASDYHSDHIGCAATILAMFPLQKIAYDRGGSYTTQSYTNYVNAVGTKRRTAAKGQVITLDAGSANPVTITFVALNGNGISTTDENDLSLVSLIRFGQFDAECGGDLSGSGTGTVDADPNEPTAAAYADIESSVAALVGKIEVYKVHRHGSRYSSNASWLSTTTPKVGIMSMGSANSYGYPTIDALTRLHNAGVRTYWTSVGNGAGPVPGQDVIAGNVEVEVSPGSTTFSVKYGFATDTYSDWGNTSTSPTNPSPFGSFDTPASGSTVTGEVAVTGWALDDSGVTGVDVYRSPLTGERTQANGLVFVGAATLVAGARPDILASYPSYPGVNSAGWGYTLLSNMLPNHGNAAFTLSVYVRTMDGANNLLGSKTVTFANAGSNRPFGTIDTPQQGQTVSGTITNFGWALTPQPNSIPFDGSTLDVYVDGTVRGHPTYNNFRSDIATLFPGYANSNGAVGYFTLDTTALANGVHTIAWVVRDNVGNASGIGSRYFTVSNLMTAGALKVSISGPAAGASYTAPATISISATAGDVDGSVTRVDFYAGMQLVGSATASPFSTTWSNVPAGTYSLTAVATNNGGETATSLPISVTVAAAQTQPLPTTLVFVPPVDYATNVDSCTVQLRRSVDAVTASPVATRNLGKPAVVGGEISVNISTLVDPLPAGSYYAVVVATGPGGSTPSSPSAVFSK